MNDDKEPVFVNRHGKKMSQDGATLEVPPVNETPFIPPPQAKPPKKVRVRRRSRFTRKKLMVVGLVILGLLLLPVIGGELVRARYISSREGARAELVSFVNKTVIPQQKKQVTLTGLGEAAAKVESIRDNSCAGGFLDNLADLYPRATEAFRDCVTAKQKIAAVAVGLRDMESQVRYLESLSPALSTVTKISTDDFAVISAQLANWQILNEELGKLSPAATQKTAHDQLKVQTKAIVDAWSALSTANDNQDAAGFAAAEKKLGEAYEAFRTSGSVLTTVLSNAQTSITNSYKAL